MRNLKCITIILIVVASFALVACGGSNTSTNVDFEDVQPTEVPLVNIMGNEIPYTDIESGYSFDLFGQEVNTVSSTELEYVKVEIGDEGIDTFESILPYMLNLKSLKLDRCGTSDEKVAELRDKFPNIDIVWRVYIGPYAIMSDEETLWASCDISDYNSEPLKYCTKLKYLDIGHCAITDISFVSYMPDLEVLIVSCSPALEDISPIESLQKMWFFECSECDVRDLTPISKCSSLRELNCGGNMAVKNLESLYSLTQLERFYCNNMYGTHYNMTDEQEKAEKLMPNTEIDFSWCEGGALNNEWRFKSNGEYCDTYKTIREIFNYDDLNDAKPFAYYLN